MSLLATRFFGEVEYSCDAVICFPDGIPGFEDEREFVFIHQPVNDPLMFLQSLQTRNLCFMTLPVHSVDPEYSLELTPDDRRCLSLQTEAPLQFGDNVLCVALVTTEPEKTPRANMMAPIVVNLANRLAAQIIRPSSGYSSRHPLVTEGQVTCL